MHLGGIIDYSYLVSLHTAFLTQMKQDKTM